MLLYGLLYNNFYLVIKNWLGPTRPGADPGFQVGWGANPGGWGVPTYNFAKITEKLHEIEKILGRGPL